MDTNHFHFTQPGSKSLTVSTGDNGDFYVEGWAARFDGLDRQGEQFAPGAFRDAIARFLSQQSAFCVDHRTHLVIGKVLQLEERPEGLWMRARVDGATRNDPTLQRFYHQIKGGTINALSVGGYFSRALVNGARKIIRCDFTEISATAVPAFPGTTLAVAAGKALGSPVDDLSQLRADVAGIRSTAARARSEDADRIRRREYERSRRNDLWIKALYL